MMRPQGRSHHHSIERSELEHMIQHERRPSLTLSEGSTSHSTSRRRSKNHRKQRNGDHHHYINGIDNVHGGGGGGTREGPAVLTMLFIAVALATLFNMSKNSSNQLAYPPGQQSVAFKHNLRNGGPVPYAQHMHSNGFIYNYNTGQVGVTYGADAAEGMRQYGMQGPSEMLDPNRQQGQPQVNVLPGQMSVTADNRNGMMQQQQQQQQPMSQDQQQQQQQVMPDQQQQQQQQQGQMMTTSTDGMTSTEQQQQTQTQTQTVAQPAAPLEVPAASKVLQPIPEEDTSPSLAAAAPIPQGEALASPELAGYKDTWDPYEDTDQPVFWHIPKAGGSTVKDIMGTCHRFTMASEAGVYEGHDQDTEIGVVRPGGVPADQDPSPFVNVDTTTVPGIERAAKMGLADSQLADFIVTPFIYESEQLFNPNARGRLFTVFRHPVDRAVSLFFYLQVADWEPTYNPDLANWSIEQYAQSDIVENNWMVRQLTNSYDGDLTQQHLDLAMDIIRRKFLVGLLHEKRRTMDRVEKFFRFKYRVMPENQEKCREQLLTGGSNSNEGNKKEKPKPGDAGYDLLAQQNQLDIQLYEYIVSVFEEQEQFVQGIPDGYRQIDATCAKCVPPTFPPLSAMDGGGGGGGEVASTAAAPPPELPATGSVLDLPLPKGEPMDIPELPGYKDLTDPHEETDCPLFWHIPKAGGSTVKDILGTCHRFVIASEAGVFEGHGEETEIGVVRPGGVPADQDPSPFVNVDTTTIPGIERAKRLGLAESGLADFIVTSYIFEPEQLFDPQHRGRWFTVFRHPVDRAVSLFFYLQVADWEPTYNPDLANWSISDYAKSPLIENNWMVRQLTGAYGGDLNEEHLNVAKDIIRRKFLVGLLHEKLRTMDRVEKFFRLKYRVMPENQEKCRDRLLTGGSNSNEGNKKEKPKPGDESWELIAWQNIMDIKLYEYILELFEEQEALVADIPDGFRSIDATCAKCVPPTFPPINS